MFSSLVPESLKFNITVDGQLSQQSYTMVILIVRWPLELGDTGVNKIISVVLLEDAQHYTIPQLAAY